ncbi:hypothetical protein M426DRAFT_7776 [Hypoxylon sp. CI-4A]|nr:hypothetical protein M426DRAFT_7776 [Hypoxylon sp. CI-4A]
MPSTFTFKTTRRPEQVPQQTNRPETYAPGRPFENASSIYPRATRPANLAEIYGLALGTCFLIALLGIILLKIIHSATRSHASESERENRMLIDPESGNVLEDSEIKGTRSLLSAVQRASPGLLRSARRTSKDVADGFKRDICEIRKALHTSTGKDEESALCDAEKNGTRAEGPFLRRPRQTEDVISA